MAKSMAVVCTERYLECSLNLKVNGTSFLYARGLSSRLSGVQDFSREECHVDGGVYSSSSPSSIFGFTCFLTYFHILFFPYPSANQYYIQTDYTWGFLTVLDAFSSLALKLFLSRSRPAS